MSKDDVADAIREAFKEGRTLTAEDFEGRPCSYCGDLIDFAEWPENVVTLEGPIADYPEEDSGYVARTYFCSKDCKEDAVHDVEWLNGDRYGQRDDIPVGELEPNR